MILGLCLLFDASFTVLDLWTSWANRICADEIRYPVDSHVANCIVATFESHFSIFLWDKELLECFPSVHPFSVQDSIVEYELIHDFLLPNAVRQTFPSGDNGNYSADGGIIPLLCSPILL